MRTTAILIIALVFALAHAEGATNKNTVTNKNSVKF